MCLQPWMSVIYEGDTISVLSQECSSMCLQTWMSVIYEGDIASVLFQECSSMCRQPGRRSQQIYPMTGPDSHWMPLVHKYLHDFKQKKQDGVAFQDYQVGGKEVMPYC